tara:strand:- start:5 stop:277 length:273 start_codon:yes stop_codon:yes gene_type:complete
MNDLTCKHLELRLKNSGWKEEFIGLWSNDLFDFYIDTNSDVIVVRDLDDNRIESFDLFDVSESTPIKAVRFVDYLNNSSTAIAYRSDQPF